MTCHGVAAPAAQSNRRTVGGVANRLGFFFRRTFSFTSPLRHVSAWSVTFRTVKLGRPSEIKRNMTAKTKQSWNKGIWENGKQGSHQQTFLPKIWVNIYSTPTS